MLYRSEKQLAKVKLALLISPLSFFDSLFPQWSFPSNISSDFIFQEFSQTTMAAATAALNETAVPRPVGVSGRRKGAFLVKDQNRRREIDSWFLMPKHAGRRDRSPRKDRRLSHSERNKKELRESEIRDTTSTPVWMIDTADICTSSNSRRSQSETILEFVRGMRLKNRKRRESEKAIIIQCIFRKVFFTS